MTRRLATVLAAMIGVSVLSASDWPGWRGPHGDGVSEEKNIPTKWSKTENIRWKTAIPGKVHSSPVVSGDRIFLTTCREKEGKRSLLCLDRASGKVLWEKVVVQSKLEEKHRLNSFASSTPAA